MLYTPVHTLSALDGLRVRKGRWVEGAAMKTPHGVPRNLRTCHIRAALPYHVR